MELAHGRNGPEKKQSISEQVSEHASGSNRSVDGAKRESSKYERVDDSGLVPEVDGRPERNLNLLAGPGLELVGRLAVLSLEFSTGAGFEYIESAKAIQLSLLLGLRFLYSLVFSSSARWFSCQT